MKLTKNLLAIAVAGAMVAPVAMADVEVYGKAHVSAGMLDNDATDGDSFYMLPNTSNVGVRGTEDLGNGLKGLYQMEMGIDWSGNNGTAFGGANAHTLRDTYVGLGGGWGSFLLGRVNSPYKMATNNLDPFADTVGDFNAIMGASPTDTGAAPAVGSIQHDNRLSNSITYKSNNINGFELAGTWALNDGQDLGATRDRQVLSLSATYKAGPIYVGGGYQNAMEYGGQTGTDFEDSEAMKLGAAYSFAQDNGTITGVYETIDSGNNLDRDAYFVSGAWKMGATKLALGVGIADDVGSTSETDAMHVTGGVYHSLSKATQVYGLYTQLDAGANAGRYGAGYALSGFAPSREGASGDLSAMGVFFGVIHNFSSK